MKRVILIVLDSVGIGELPDADRYGDTGANTLGNIARLVPSLSIPHLVAMGLGNIDVSNALPASANPTSAYGKAAELSEGKDTTTGHWEICGTVLERSFPLFPKGFPQKFIIQLEEAIGAATIGNVAASGTAIINRLGAEHLATKRPIVYTSADSVFQIAMHESVFPLEQQYNICQKARNLLTGNLEVGRVIARPFVGEPGAFTRTKNRKDFALQPPNNLLTSIRDSGKIVHAIGKSSIFLPERASALT